MANVTMRQLLEAGVHFGHRTRYWNPKMNEYIFGDRNRIHIINLEQTLPLLKDACSFAGKIAASGGRVLFVGTKRAARDAVEEEAKRSGMPFVNQRWLGGTLTNFKTVKGSIKRLIEMEKQLEDGSINRLTKKEQLNFSREIEKLRKSLGGIKQMPSLPDCLFVVDTGYEKNAIAEARKLGIPVIAVVDTNNDPAQVDYVIPGNDDATRAIRVYAQCVADAIIEGRGTNTTGRAEEFVDESEERAAPRRPRPAGPRRDGGKPSRGGRGAAEQTKEKLMAQITAALVKELRDRTGAGMGDCKKALEATDGNLDQAAEKLRMDGAAKADKKAGRTAAEGVLAFAVGPQAVAVAELNCETDFVAKGEEFRDLARRAAAAALANKPADIDALVNIKDGTETLDETRRAMVGRIGENMTIRRFQVVPKAAGPIVTYMHQGDKIGVIVALDAGDEATGKDVAMHIAAMSPRFLSAAEFSKEAIADERRIIEATVAQEQADAKTESEKLAGVLKEMDAEKQNGTYDGLSADDKKSWDDDYASIKKKFGGGFKAKPAEILAKMIDGKVAKFISENTLLGQAFVKNGDQTVEQMLKEKGAKVAQFVRFAVGEGIERTKVDFAAEVMAQAGIKA